MRGALIFQSKVFPLITLIYWCLAVTCGSSIGDSSRLSQPMAGFWVHYNIVYFTYLHRGPTSCKGTGTCLKTQ